MVHKTIIDEEIQLDPKKYIVSKTDTDGIIEYANDYFIEISGYSMAELMESPHNILRHPDMPKTIFKMLWDRLNDGQEIVVLIKNRAKDGRYYWVVTEFESNFDKITNKPISHTAYRKGATAKMVEEIEPLYKKLLEIEESLNIEDAQKYLVGYLEERGKSYDEYIKKVTNSKGLIKKAFGGVAGLFKKKK
ncbi:SIGNAL-TRANSDUCTION SENSOR PROTEIN-PAS/PAC domain [hydrothermal vent metagenome]|uniref:SIGNAL-TRANSDUCTION SENSOR PROTEIN-PAS/PAC domain n=1 Tax=hydrothermal vent metagenome TaxID=652676 RepID=A0A1W1EK51_9ZZZZ